MWPARPGAPRACARPRPPGCRAARQGGRVGMRGGWRGAVSPPWTRTGHSLARPPAGRQNRTLGCARGEDEALAPGRWSAQQPNCCYRCSPSSGTETVGGRQMCEPCEVLTRKRWSVALEMVNVDLHPPVIFVLCLSRLRGFYHVLGRKQASAGRSALIPAALRYGT